MRIGDVTDMGHEIKTCHGENWRCHGPVARNETCHGENWR